MTPGPRTAAGSARPPRLALVISCLDLRGRTLDASTLREVLPRAEFDVADATHVVRPLLQDVRERGAVALRDLGERFDGVRPRQLRVPPQALAAALDGLEADVRAGLEESIRRVRRVHADQLPAAHSTQVVPGGQVRQRWIPVSRVGLYVPGGRAVYPSSVVMNVVPAQIAGVRSLAVASPPQRDHDGAPHPVVLAACALLGVQEVYAVGGAQAIAMFAYGAREPGTDPDGQSRDNTGEVLCEPVELVTGPGNVYVASAKRALKGVVGIDAEAGPSEITILADDGADPEYVAADLLSQAEHDPLAASVLVTDSEPLARRVHEALARRVAATKHQERVRAALTGRQSAIVLVDDLQAGIAVVDAHAAEHLQIHTRDAPAVAERIHNAGAIFVGDHSPVSLGDYSAGSNHVLPTSGTAAHDSGLSVHSFLRAVQVIEYDAPALAEVAGRVVALARAEDLPGHAEAILARVGEHQAPADEHGPPARSDAEIVGALLRPDLAGRTPYGAPQLEVPVALNTNENSYPVPPQVAAAITRAVTQIAPNLNRYPDRECTDLRTDLAAYLTKRSGVPVAAAQVWAGNGSNEVLLHLLQAFGGPGRTALGFTPSYSMHPIIAATTGTAWLDGTRGGPGPDAGAAFDLTADSVAAQVRRHRPHLVFLCSPNNPTGTALDLEVVQAAYDASDDAIVVVDEAYAEFARPGTSCALTLLAGRPRLVLTRTMSKAFALAGARLGYLGANPALVDTLRLVRMPYHLSTVTQAVARAALGHADALLANVEAIKAQRDRIVAEVRALDLTAVVSDANFVLVGGFVDAPAAWRALLDRGVLVRDVGLPGYLRVTAGTPAETDAFLAALRSVVPAHPERRHQAPAAGGVAARDEPKTATTKENA